MPKQQNNADENNLNLYNPRPKTIVFEGFTNNDETPFRPNLTPSQILRAGAFGGTYFRKITSTMINIRLKIKNGNSKSMKRIF